MLMPPEAAEAGRGYLLYDDLWPRPMEIQKPSTASKDNLVDETYKAFKDFENLLIETHGKPQCAWMTRFAIDARGGRYRCDRNRFLKSCQDLGYSKNAGLLFDCLRPEAGVNMKHYLSLADLWPPRWFDWVFVEPNKKQT